MINSEDKQKIKDDVHRSFIERNRSTIAEKISDLISAGFTECEAHDTVIQVVKNLSNDLLPIKVMSQGDVVSDYKLTLVNDELARHEVGLATHFPDDDFE